MSYKNDSNLVIANRFGDASSAAKAQLWETYDRLRDLTVSGSGTGTGLNLLVACYTIWQVYLLLLLLRLYLAVLKQ